MIMVINVDLIYDKFNMMMMMTMIMNIYQKKKTEKFEAIDKYRITVQSYLISTIFSQNEVINNLLNWKLKENSITDSLKQIQLISIDNILHFLYPIFQRLLEIIETNIKERMNAFNTLIYVLSLIVNEKKETEKYVYLLTRFKEKIDQTIPKKPTISQVILECVLFYFSNWTSRSNAKFIRSTIRVLPILMKIVFVHSDISYIPSSHFSFSSSSTLRRLRVFFKFEIVTKEELVFLNVDFNEILSFVLFALLLLLL